MIDASVAPSNKRNANDATLFPCSPLIPLIAPTIIPNYPFYRTMEKYNLYLEEQEANGIKEVEESK